MLDSLVRKFHPLLNVAIEATNDCNMNCGYCYRKERETGYMDFNLYANIINQLPQSCRVALSFGGESLLHPQFKQMVHYAATRKFRDLNIYSNGLVGHEGLPIRVVVNPKPPKTIFTKDFKLLSKHDLKPQYDWCRSLYCYMAILWNGDVVPCCYDIAGMKVMGNVKNKSIKAVWNNETYRLLRRQGFCHDCELYKYVSDYNRGQVFESVASIDGSGRMLKKTDSYCCLTNAKVELKDCFNCHFEAIKIMLKNAEANVSAIDGLIEIVWQRAFNCSAKIFRLERSHVST